MKKILNTLFVIALMLVARPAFAVSLQDLQVRELSKIAVAAYNDYNDATLMKITYSGAEATAVVNIGSGTLSIDAPIGTVLVSSAAVDFYDNAAMNTLGELCDYIDAQTGLACSLTGGKRNDAANLSYSPVQGQSIKAAAGYEVLIGTGGIYSDLLAEMNRVGITPQDGKRVLLKYCNVTNDGTGVLEIFGKLMKFTGLADGVTRNDTTNIVSFATANDTVEVDGNIYGGYWLEFAKDEHVVISAGTTAGTGGTTQTATSSLECFWDEK
jgi:hypothetical protein